MGALPDVGKKKQAVYKLESMIGCDLNQRGALADAMDDDPSRLANVFVNATASAKSELQRNAQARMNRLTASPELLDAAKRREWSLWRSVHAFLHQNSQLPELEQGPRRKPRGVAANLMYSLTQGINLMYGNAAGGVKHIVDESAYVDETLASKVDDVDPTSPWPVRFYNQFSALRTHAQQLQAAVYAHYRQDTEHRFASDEAHGAPLHALVQKMLVPQQGYKDLLQKLDERLLGASGADDADAASRRALAGMIEQLKAEVTAWHEASQMARDATSQLLRTPVACRSALKLLQAAEPEPEAEALASPMPSEPSGEGGRAGTVESVSAAGSLQITEPESKSVTGTGSARPGTPLSSKAAQAQPPSSAVSPSRTPSPSTRSDVTERATFEQIEESSSLLSSVQRDIDQSVDSAEPLSFKQVKQLIEGDVAVLDALLGKVKQDWREYRAALTSFHGSDALQPTPGRLAEAAQVLTVIDGKLSEALKARAYPSVRNDIVDKQKQWSDLQLQIPAYSADSRSNVWTSEQLRE